MSNFIVCTNAVLPLFLIMMLGYGCKRAGIIKDNDVLTINGLMFKIFLPFMVFNNLYSSGTEFVINTRLLVFSVVAVLLDYLISLLVTCLIIKERKNISAVVQGLYRSNFVVVGLPIVSSLVATTDTTTVAILIAVIIPIYNVLAVITIEYFAGKKSEPLGILLNIAKNPLITGCVVGLVFVLLKIKLPIPIEKAVSQVSTVASPCLLFLLGAYFNFTGLRKYKKEIALACVGKLIIMPAAFLGAAIGFGFRDMPLACILGMAGSGVATSTFPMTQQGGGNGELAVDIVVMSNFVCTFTLFGYSLLLKTLNLI